MGQSNAYGDGCCRGEVEGGYIGTLVLAQFLMIFYGMG